MVEYRFALPVASHTIQGEICLWLLITTLEWRERDGSCEADIEVGVKDQRSNMMVDQSTVVCRGVVDSKYVGVVGCRGSVDRSRHHVPFVSQSRQIDSAVRYQIRLCPILCFSFVFGYRLWLFCVCLRLLLGTGHERYSLQVIALVGQGSCSSHVVLSFFASWVSGL
jgi:hypothetical protein